MRVFPYSLLVSTAIAVLALYGTGYSAPKPKDIVNLASPITVEQLSASAKNLESIALAFHNYHDAHGTMPTNVLSKDKKPVLSWRVQILPYFPDGGPLAPPDKPVVREDKLYKSFKLDEPWDSEHNKKLIDKMPRMYAPVRGKFESGLTFYQAFGGTNGWLKAGARLVASFPDGTSNTFLAAEAAKPVVWTKPDDMEFNGKDVPALGGLFDGRFHAAMVSGDVRRFRKGVAANILKLLVDPADGTVLPEDYGLDTEDKK